MTEPLRQSLLTACAFARVFMEAADAELREETALRVGSGTQILEPLIVHRRRSLAQLQAALERVSDESPCQTPGCGHSLFYHEGLTGGMCLKGACHCMAYKEVAP